MFYDIFEKLCSDKKEKPGRVADKCGINRSNVTQWKKNGYTPRPDALDALSKYFNVSTDYLLGKEKRPAAEISNEQVMDEFVAFYGNVKENLTQTDLNDLKKLMQLRAELNLDK
ncbi:MAG: helix-turn-helix transcriptional regulator [Ruthenibacterium sp.]